MSEKQSEQLPSAPDNNGEISHLQGDGTSQIAEILHADGSRETVQISASRYWQGALPRPEDFSKYADVVPDAPERILKMAELEQAHRIASESKLIAQNGAAGLRGQWLGAIVSVVALSLAVLSVALDASWQVSAALVGVPVLSVARSLVLAFRENDD